MMNIKSNWAGVVFAGVALLSVGCESSQTKTARLEQGSGTKPVIHSGMPAHYPPALVTPAMMSQQTGPQNLIFTAPNQGGHTPQPEVGRTSGLIGLYGEFIGANAEAGEQFDGGTNVMQVTAATDGACFDPTASRDGNMIAFASTMHRKTADIYIKSIKGKTLTQVTNDPADDVMPAFSPDGKGICFASNRTGNWDIYAVNLDGMRTMQVTNDADHELHPTWSPDGKMVAYCKFGSQSQRWELWCVDVSNPGMKHFLDYGMFPQWSPDPMRNKILFQRAKQRGSRDYSVWTLDYSNGQATYPTEIVSAANAALINPSWSPDGSKIVFVSVVDPNETPGARPGQTDLWVVNLDGSGRTSLTNGQFANFQPVWAGSTVYFVSDRSGIDNIWAVRPPMPGMKMPSEIAGVDTSKLGR